MDFVTTLKRDLGADIITEPNAIEVRYMGDWMCRAEAVHPMALARPRTTAEVSAILRLCHSQHVPVVPQGGRTGLAGGATPGEGWLILSLERMHTIAPANTASASIVVGAGALLQSVQEAADDADLLFPLDIGARGSCTIGGNISTNAGGNRVLRYGMMRDLVLGLEVVLADGTTIHAMNTLLKNNAGYDLKQLFIGSEGTLGVVTGAVLRLFPKPRSVQTALCAVANYEAVLSLLQSAKSQLGANLSAFEVMWPDFYRLGTDGLGRRAPVAHGYGLYILVESMGTDEERDELQFQDFVEKAFGEGFLQDAVIAHSVKERREIWAVRDSSGEFRKTLWPNVGFDVSLPVDEIGRFVKDCRTRLLARWKDAQSVWFGHAADSNLHICVRLPGFDTQPEHEIDALIYGCVGDYGGSVSAEHGIGLLKRDYLYKSRNEQERATMRLLKRALDPNNILNPGKIWECNLEIP